jgi:hypothetical protein
LASRKPASGEVSPQRGSQPLPETERGDALEELRSFFNVDHHG